MRRKLLLTACLAGLLALAIPVAAGASLTLLKPNPSDPATFVGKGGYSADGLGQIGTGGFVQAEIPTGSTVEQAYLYGTYFFDLTPSLSDRTITVDSTPVVLTQISSLNTCCALATARGDVTSLVAAKVGSPAAGGIYNFQINSDPPSLDGVGLVVIFSNPLLPDTTIAVLDGSASQSGDTATFTFAAPLDKTIPGFSAIMSLGSGFSAQDQSGPGGNTFCGTDANQSSIVDVNGTRLTSCAGNLDDGVGTVSNGILITVGGVGDSIDNPTDPFQEPADGKLPRVHEDELYNLDPFLAQGDSGVTITSSNPSQDDNLFLAIIAITAKASVCTPPACGPGPPATLTLSPKSATNQVGNQHCVTATVKDASGAPVPGVTVNFSASGANSASGSAVTDANGQATFCYTGTTAGSDTITATAQGGSNPSDTATKDWTPGPPATLTLSPRADVNTVDSQHCVTATVKDSFGNPTPGIPVRFTVTGSVSTSGTVITDANGQATFCYQGPALPGTDVITAFADTNKNGVQDRGEPSDRAKKVWVLPQSTPGCKVTDGGRITAANGDKATFGSVAKVAADGTPSGAQEYQDHGPAADINVHSTAVTAVVCRADGKSVSVFGTATINGSGSFNYRIDMVDNGEPGTADTYRIRISNGYDSGTQVLTGGNIQLH